MKILLMGDASNYHRALGNGLEALGHDVTVASHGTHWMNTSRDIDLRRRPGRTGGLILYSRLLGMMRHKLSGYDVVQICGPSFVELRPERIGRIFDLLKGFNRRVYLTAIGTDSYFVERCNAEDAPLDYSEWRVNDKPTDFALSAVGKRDEWLTPEMRAHCRRIYDNVDGVVSVLYEYHKVLEGYFPADKLSYAGIPVELDKVRPVPLPSLQSGEPVRITMAYHRGRTMEKGIEFLREAVRRVERENPGRIVVDELCNIPYDEFLARMESSHIIVDQLYSYTPATTALLGMAKGRVVVSGGEEEYYDFIEESELRPVINPDPRDFELTVKRLSDVVRNPGILRKMSLEGPEFVRRHNDAEIVARRYLNFWKRNE